MGIFRHAAYVIDLMCAPDHDSECHGQVSWYTDILAWLDAWNDAFARV